MHSLDSAVRCFMRRCARHAACARCARLAASILAASIGFTAMAATATVAASPTDPPAVVQGAGATFPYPVYQRWAETYRRQTGIDIRYDPVGSPAGIEAVEQQRTDFAASEVPLSPAELTRRGLMQFPAVIGAVVPVVNIAGIRQGALRLSGKVLGDIYLGRIRRWDDPAITELNPELALPGQNITAVHRGDPSGTTFLWSRYLSRTNGDWQHRFGAATVVDWPGGVAETGSDGVASAVQRTKASIGYVEFAYARTHSLNCAALGNGGPSAVFVNPDLASFKAASHDGNGGWPITAPSFVLLPIGTEHEKTATQVMRFFSWAWRTGTATATELGYLLPSEAVVDKTEEEWRKQTGKPTRQ